MHHLLLLQLVHSRPRQIIVVDCIVDNWIKDHHLVSYCKILQPSGHARLLLLLQSWYPAQSSNHNCHIRTPSTTALRRYFTYIYIYIPFCSVVHPCTNTPCVVANICTIILREYIVTDMHAQTEELSWLTCTIILREYIVTEMHAQTEELSWLTWLLIRCCCRCRQWIIDARTNTYQYSWKPCRTSSVVPPRVHSPLIHNITQPNRFFVHSLLHQ